VKTVFVDTAFWIASIHPKDQYHQQATKIAEEQDDAFWVTTDIVLIETLNAFSEFGAFYRVKAADYVRAIMLSENVEVVYHGRSLLVQGIDFYRQRADKGYSLTDCISMLVMQDRAMREVLTSDKHFRQEGFVPLLEA
jgi:uncharacterized protein